MVLEEPLAIVDLETTGAHPAFDRVTEIAVIQANDGRIVDTWSTLVDPETAIPAAIQALTGITNRMVAGAPTFRALAQDLFERLQGRMLIAHNARFDYGFLRHEFERAGLKFQAKTLCTVKLSRRLFPEHARHNLDSLIARHGLACSARHRALGDAEAVWDFLRVATEERGLEAVTGAAKRITRLPALPPHVDRAVIDAIPAAPGVYLFFGEGGAPLYVGKSVNLRARVLSHFADDVRSARQMRLARETRSIDWERTAGELGALLRESELVKKLVPAFNRKLRRMSGPCSLAVEPKRRADAALKTRDWPWRGAVGIVEEDRERELTEVHVVDQWCWLGTADSESALAELLQDATPRFDPDHYKLLTRHLLGAHAPRVRELTRCT